jgi:hypothetical protein
MTLIADLTYSPDEDTWHAVLWNEDTGVDEHFSPSVPTQEQLIGWVIKNHGDMAMREETNPIEAGDWLEVVQ